MGRTWTVRRAASDDGPPVVVVAAAAWRDTYQGLLRSQTIEAFIERAYSPERVAQRIAEDHFYLAVDAGRIVAFADAIERDGRLELAAIYALPDMRGQGAGTALLNELVEMFPDRDMSADVVTGNRKGEIFYERRGFAPRESMDAILFGEPVSERRWWRPGATRPAS